MQSQVHLGPITATVSIVDKGVVHSGGELTMKIVMASEMPITPYVGQIPKHYEFVVEVPCENGTEEQLLIAAYSRPKEHVFTFRDRFRLSDASGWSSENLRTGLDLLSIQNHRDKEGSHNAMAQGRV